MLNDYIQPAVSFDAVFKWFGKPVCSNVVVLQQCFHLGLGSAHAFLDRTQNLFLFTTSPPLHSGKRNSELCKGWEGKNNTGSIMFEICDQKLYQDSMYSKKKKPARGPKQCGVRIFKGKGGKDPVAASQLEKSGPSSESMVFSQGGIWNKGYQVRFCKVPLGKSL